MQLAKNMYVFMGGTFDPVHQGHIQGALQVSALFDNNAVHLLPAKIPVHKSAPTTSVEQRIEMLQLVVDKTAELQLDLREINRAEQSFTIDTLKQLRRELGATTPLVMVIGMDSFSSLPQWRDSRQFLGYCHILVLQRPPYVDLNDAHKQGKAELEQHREFFAQRIFDVKKLSSAAGGCLYFYQQPPIAISASEIRQQIKNKKHSYLLPIAVANYINQHHLYQ
ncbi:MAG: hypothetical protein OFPII_37700 [Osedax symbiont Rs1]|nr:MAG: hypothetical protein OFPII_37700 [Osedax symbiont Rs1]